MSQISDALGSSAGGTSNASGASDFGDTPNLTDSTFSGMTDADIMGGSGGGGGSGGPSEFGNIVSALTGIGGASASPVAAQSAAMSPPSAAASSGGDPTGAASGTQSSTTPGSSPPTQNQQQTQPQAQGEHAPPDAVAELRTLLKGLAGKPTGPTGQIPLPGVARGETGPQAPLQPNMPLAKLDLNAEMGRGAGAPILPTLAARETGPQSPPMLPKLTAGETGEPSATEPQTDAQGRPLTVAGTPAADTPLPPPRPDASTTGGKPTPKTDDQGHAITVHAAGGDADAGGEADLPTHTPLPTHKPGPESAPDAQPGQSRMIQDITGQSTGAPMQLADLAKAVMTLAPLIGMFMGGGGRRGHFRGGGFGRFGGYRGGMNAMHYHGGQHPSAPGAWPYHHPQFGWHMHGRPPGPGWLPLNPVDARSILGGQNGQNPGQNPDPNRPPKETGADPGPATDAPSGAIPGVSGKAVDDYTRQVAQRYNIDPNVASKVLGQESSYGQARRPGDDGSSFGPFQLHFARDGHAMGDEFMRDTGKDPRDPSTWKAQVDYAMMRAATGGWKPWTTTMKKLGMNEWSGINRRFAGQPMSTTQPAPVSKAASIPTELPLTSQPMVGG